MFRLLPLLTFASACGGDPVDIGDDQTAKTGETMSDFAAKWVGYAQAHTFWQGSDAIRITLDENGEGTLEVGEAPPLPPATNPDVGYPEGEEGSPTHANVLLRSGFSYSVEGATVEDRRLRLGINLYELYDGWCEMQTAYLDEASSTYHCLPNSSGGADDGQCFLDDPETGEPIYVDCVKIGMCMGGDVCSCTAEGCNARFETRSVRLDAALESAGDELEGTLTVAGNVIVRMTRE